MVLQLVLVQILLLTLMSPHHKHYRRHRPKCCVNRIQGNAITIVNVTNDGQGNPVAGASSGTGWELSHFNRCLHKINKSRWRRNTADPTQAILTSLGVFSVHNGLSVGSYS